MSLSDVFWLLRRHWLLLLIVPLTLSVSTYFFARHLPQVYSSDTTIYTGIASGYTLAGNVEANNNAASNAFDNLINLAKARSTKEAVVYQMLATHLWQTSQNPALLSVEPYSALAEALPVDIRRNLAATTATATLERVRRYAQANNTNAIYRLLNSSDPTYSLTALEALTAARIGSSDLMKITFESHNPEICRYTLELVTQVFLNQSKGLHEGQTASVIRYYESELVRAKDRLTEAESKNLSFNRANNIINYDEQSKKIAAAKEDLANELNQATKEYAGANAALNAIRQRLGGRAALLLNSSQMLEQRRKLGQLNEAIANQQLFNQQQETGTNTKVAQLQADAEKMQQAIQRSIDTYYAGSTSTEGVSSKELLTEWVQDMTAVESNRAKLAVMAKRQQQFEQEYQRMAPLGATLKRIEREISLAEAAYLAVLNSLNASKASQENTQLTANLKVVDQPNLPVKPKTSKLLKLVALSAVGGFVFAASLVLGLGLLDRSLRNPRIASRRIGLPVVGIVLNNKGLEERFLQDSKQHNLDQLVRHILLKANTPPAAVPFVIGVVSLQHQDDKNILCQGLAQRCYEMGIHTLALYPDSNGGVPHTEEHSGRYPSEVAAVQGWQLEQLIKHAAPKQMMEASGPNAQVILVELPALREETLPVGILKQLNLVFLIVPASRPWLPKDHQSLQYLRMATSAPVEVVLTEVARHESKDLIG